MSMEIAEDLGPANDLGEPGDHEQSSLRDNFRKRRIAISTMDRPLRIATAVTIAGLLSAALLIALRAIPAAPVSLGSFNDVQMTLSEPLFVAALLLLSVGYGYLVAGAMFGNLAVSIFGVVSVTLLVGWQTGVLGIGGLDVVLPGWARGTTTAILGLIWLMTVAVLLIRRGRHGDDSRDRRLRVAVLLATSVLFATYFLILWLASPVFNGLTLFPQSVSLLMSDVAILATPILMVAAIDFGEWGEFSAQRLARLRLPSTSTESSPRRSRVAAIVVCAVALVFGALLASGGVLDRIAQVAQGLFLMLLAVVILLVAGRVLRVSKLAWPRSVSFVALVCVCGVITWGGGFSVALLSGAFQTASLPPVSSHGDYTPAASVRSVTGITGFSALVPVVWSVTSDKGNYIDFIDNHFPDGLSTHLAALVVPATETVQSLNASFGSTLAGPVTADGTWKKVLIAPKTGGIGAVWLAGVSAPSGMQRVFYGSVVGPNAQYGLDQLEAIVRTVRPSGEPAATLPEVLAASGNTDATEVFNQRHSDVIQSLSVAFALGSAGLLALLMLLFGRRWSGTWRAAIVFYGAAATITFVAASDSVWRLVFGEHAWFPVLTVAGILGGAGILGAIAIIVAARRRSTWAVRLPNALIGMVGAVIILGLINLLYGVALQAAEVPAWAAVLILAAIGWDITMSGESMTNLSSRAFPRSTRVVMFFGYVLVLASAMVFFSGQLSAATGGRAAEAFFEPESITQAALFRIGLPLLLAMFLVHLVSPVKDPDAQLAE